MDRAMTEPRPDGGRIGTPEPDGGTRITLRQLETEGADALALAGIEEAGLDAHRLLLEAFGLDETHYLLERMRPVTADAETAADGANMSGAAGKADMAAAEPAADGVCAGSSRTARYRGMISRRAARIPLQQILGRQEFMGLSFRVNENVLIPRQDTETLAELVLAEQKDPEKKVLDLCTGSGCIAISLAVKGGFTDVTATDLSAEALAVAEQNAEMLLAGAPVPRRYFRLYRGDLFAALPQGSRYDIIVSNPPYIPSAVIGGLQPEVRDHEPRMALDGAEDGLAFYRRIAAEAPEWMNPGGAIYLEIGCDQAEAVSDLLSEAGFEKIEVFKDLPGLDRVVRAFRPRG